MIIPRIYDNLETILEPNKVIVIYGPRRVGKTTLLQQFVKRTTLKYRFDTGEDLQIQNILSSQRLDHLKQYAAGFDLIILDEAQLIPNIGLGLKLMVDHIPNIKIIATGSASFDLSNKIGEPLVGRKWTKILYPVSQLELRTKNTDFDLKNKQEEYLIYGSYPQILIEHSYQKKQQILKEISASYLLKDILTLERIKSPKILLNLLKLIAFQIGSEVSLSELGNQLDIDKKTVQRYLDLLEKTFILYNLTGTVAISEKKLPKKANIIFGTTESETQL